MWSEARRKRLASLRRRKSVELRFDGVASRGCDTAGVWDRNQGVHETRSLNDGSLETGFAAAARDQWKTIVSDGVRASVALPFTTQAAAHGMEVGTTVRPASWIFAGEQRSGEMTPKIPHVGRLVDHIHLRTNDLERAKLFYKWALAALGRRPTSESEKHIAFDELWIDAADEKGASRIHLAFQSDSREAVDTFYSSAREAGGVDNGPPGERHYYAAFVLDPDGNNIEAVFHGPSERSAESVTIEPVQNGGVLPVEKLSAQNDV